MPTAAVILIQEWWGINDHIRDIAGRYARRGLHLVAPRICIAESSPKTPAKQQKFMQALAIEDGMAIIRAAIAETRRAHNVAEVRHHRLLHGRDASPLRARLRDQ